jgi:hypothetical protein
MPSSVEYIGWGSGAWGQTPWGTDLTIVSVDGVVAVGQVGSVTCNRYSKRLCNGCSGSRASRHCNGRRRSKCPCNRYSGSRASRHRNGRR